MSKKETFLCEMCGEENATLDDCGFPICEACYAQSQIEDAEFSECDW